MKKATSRVFAWPGAAQLGRLASLLLLPSLATCQSGSRPLQLGVDAELMLPGGAAPLSVVTADDQVVLGWLGGATHASGQIRIVRSNDGGRTFGEPETLPNASVGKAKADGPSSPTADQEPTQSATLPATTPPLLFLGKGRPLIAAWCAREIDGRRLVSSRESAPGSRSFASPSTLGQIAGASAAGAGTVPVLSAPRGNVPRPGHALAVTISSWLEDAEGWHNLVQFKLDAFPYGLAVSTFEAKEPLACSPACTPSGADPELTSSPRIVLLTRENPAAPPTVTVGRKTGTPIKRKLADAGPQTITPFLGSSGASLLVGTSAAGKGGVSLYRSEDEGQSWSRTLVATPESPAAARFAAEGMRVAVAWLDSTGDRRRVWLAVSRDGGKRFEPPRVVDPGGLGIRPASLDLALAGPHLVLAWVDGSAGGGALRTLVSADGGRTLSASRDAAPPGGTHDASPAAWATPSGAGVAWVRRTKPEPGAPLSGPGHGTVLVRFLG